MSNNIKEAEKLSGVGRQNIRYYEKMGLLHPQRNQENNYREYTEDDIQRLKRIRLFRKLDMPLEDIRVLLDGEITLECAMDKQKKCLKEEKERVADMLNFCEGIREKRIEDFDEDYYLAQMEHEERRGAIFADFLTDFKKVTKVDSESRFSFMPDTMCMNPGEFTEALCKYAKDNHINLIITKEGMYPEFTIDGMEYTACRIFTRYGAAIQCRIKNEQVKKPEGMPDRRYRMLLVLSRLWIPMLIAGIVMITHIQSPEDMLFVILIFLAIYAIGWWGGFRNLK